MVEQEVTAAATPGRRGRRPGSVGVWIAVVTLAVVTVAGLGAVLRIRSLREGSRPADAIDARPLADPATYTNGVVSYHGDDYAYDVARRRIVVCDQERDGRPVKAEYETARGLGELFDVSTDPGSCTARDVGAPITRHRVCEAHFGWTCQNWQSTT